MLYKGSPFLLHFKLVLVRHRGVSISYHAICVVIEHRSMGGSLWPLDCFSMFEKLSFYVVYGTIFVVVNIGVFFAYLDPKIEFYEPKKLGYEYNMLGLISRIIGYQNCVLMHFWGGILCVYENLCKQWINDVKCLIS